MTYDALDRLTQTTSVPFGTASYTYDQLDNLTRVTVGASTMVAARDHFYCYGATTKRLDFVRNTSCSGGAVIALDYDVQGNLKNKNNRLHTFDFGNRLRTITGGTPSITTAYAYDGQGRRVRDVVGGVSKLSQYLQSGQLSMTEDSRAGKVNEYIYLGGSLVATRERDVPTNVSTAKYYHTDALGSPIAITNPSKTVIQTSEFEPYGKVVNRAEIDGPSYTGHVQDASSGLSYMQQRYYDPMIGRFLSVDPVTADSATGANFNRYWYANNNPYKFTDPDGRIVCNRSRVGTAGCQDDPLASQKGIPRNDCRFCLQNGRGSGKVAKRKGDKNSLPSEVGIWAKSSSGEDKKKAINAVMKHYGIDPAGTKIQMALTDPYNSNMSAMRPNSGSSITLMPKAFRSSSWLAATLGHELVGHEDNYGNCNSCIIRSEIKAWNYSLDNIEKYGNSPGEVSEIRDALDHYESQQKLFDGE